MTTLLYSNQGPCQKIKVSVSAKNKQQLQQMRGKEMEDIHFVDYCQSRKPLLQSYEYKMAYCTSLNKVRIF